MSNTHNTPAKAETATRLADAYLDAANGDTAKASIAFARACHVSRKMAREWLVQNATAFASFRSFWAGSVTASVVASMEAAS